MLKKLIKATFVLLVFASCGSTKKTTTKTKSLSKAFKNDFLIGTAINTPQIEEKNPKEALLIAQQFNAITAENIMKCEVIHPTWDKYNFELADKFIAYGEKNNMFLHGHTLVWHSQLSRFASNLKSTDSFKTFFENHITTVASRYADKIKSWDVVNEALNEDGTMRKSIFLNKLGEDFVVDAFRLTQKAAPNCQLYYNDYNNEQPLKRAGTIALVKKIQAAGVRIDGVGIQGHWQINSMPYKEIEESLIAYAALGVKVSITELDIEMLPRNFTGADVGQRIASNPTLNPYTAGLPDSMQVKLTNAYQELFKIFLRHKDKIERITFWGVHDGQSWLNGWPVVGRTNYPLLFDRTLMPKPAYYSVLGLKK